MKHKEKEASTEGSKREDGTRALGDISCAVGPTGVTWSGICWGQAVLNLNSRWVSCSPTQEECSPVREIVLYFSDPCQEGTVTASSAWLSCPNTGFLCIKGLIELQTETVFLFCVFLCLLVLKDEGLWDPELRIHKHFKMQYKFVCRAFSKTEVLFVRFLDKNP